MSYQAIGLAPPTADVSFGTVAALLSKTFPQEVPAKKAHRTVANDELSDWVMRLEWPGWSIELKLVTGEKVTELARKVANVDTSRTDNEMIASCNRLIAIRTSDDPDMEHFNDYTILLQTIEELSGVVLFNTQDGSFI